MGRVPKGCPPHWLINYDHKIDSAVLAVAH